MSELKLISMPVPQADLANTIKNQQEQSDNDD